MVLYVSNIENISQSFYQYTNIMSKWKPTTPPLFLDNIYVF